jgi:hypothetical protein
MEKPIRQATLWRLSLLALLILGTVPLLSGGCTDNILGLGCHCPNWDNSLSCENSQSCCPRGYPIECGGHCYTTFAEAGRACGAQPETCYTDTACTYAAR